MRNYNQSLIEDYKQTIERLQKECTEKTDCIVSLCEKLITKHDRAKELEEKLNAQFAEMEEKLTAEENKNFELKEEIKELRDLNRRLDNQREEYWKEYLKLDKKLKIAESQMTLARDLAYDSSQAEPVRVQIDEILTQALKQMEEVK